MTKTAFFEGGRGRGVPAVRRRAEELHRDEVRVDGDEAGRVPHADEVQDPHLRPHPCQFDFTVVCFYLSFSLFVS